MIPVSILQKMKPVEIEMSNGVKLKTTLVADASTLVSRYVEEFRSVLHKNVMGFDVKTLQCGDGSKRTYGVLCVNSCCLVFLLNSGILSAGFKGLFENQAYCFVGTKVWMKVQLMIKAFEKGGSLKCETAVEIGYFVSRILSRGELEHYGLRDLASAVGILKEQPSDDRRAVKAEEEEVFSFENLKSVVEEAYTCFRIANKVLA